VTFGVVAQAVDLARLTLQSHGIAYDVESEDRLAVDYGSARATIGNFTVVSNPNGTVTVSGQVIASSLQGLTVQLGGTTTFANTAPLAVDQNGWFTIDLTLLDGESDFTATAVASAANGNSSGEARWDVR